MFPPTQADRDYNRLLKKMFTVEILGYNLYNALAAKTQDACLKPIYKKLAIGEQETAQHIKKQLPSSYTPNKIIITSTNIAFRILSEFQLSSILQKTLKKRMYSRWFKEHNSKDDKLWKVLLDHEKRQHELLVPFWNKK